MSKWKVYAYSRRNMYEKLIYLNSLLQYPIIVHDKYKIYTLFFESIKKGSFWRLRFRVYGFNIKRPTQDIMTELRTGYYFQNHWGAVFSLHYTLDLNCIILIWQLFQTGFVKAFSSSPESFTVGFATVERVMRALFVKNLFLWPRFHATVSSSLEKRKVGHFKILFLF